MILDGFQLFHLRTSRSLIILTFAGADADCSLDKLQIESNDPVLIVLEGGSYELQYARFQLVSG